MTQATGAGPVAIELRPSGASRMLNANDTFVDRHIGPSERDIAGMLAELGVGSLDELADRVVPQSIRLSHPLQLDDLDRPRGEFEVVASLRRLAEKNQVARSFIGCGYHDCITPPVIQRNILENPGWYTQYTPYQAEIAQGRLEALLNFQTMVADLTALPLANASLLDEATAAAEAMAMCHGIARGKKPAFFLSDHCHPQTRAVVRTRARSMGIDLREGHGSAIDFNPEDLSGVLVQYPATDGAIEDFTDLAQRAHEAGARLVVAADLLALTLLRPPGEFGADIAVGSTQRFGIPMGFGGPHAAYLATATEHARRVPGRLVGISRDADGRTAYRLAVQTREQHIKREKATSNICTAQVLLAIMAGMYAVYHGPAGLRRIAQRIHHLAHLLRAGLRAGGLGLPSEPFFDTITLAVGPDRADHFLAAAADRGMNLRRIDDERISISLDETTTLQDVRQLLEILTDSLSEDLDVVLAEADEPPAISSPHARQSDYLTHPVFHEHHSEHEMLRYLHRLQSRDLSLAHSMIPLGSCTMKLNGTSEMLPVTWEPFARMHPFAPPEQTRGYQAMFDQLERWLSQITGFAAVSLQPNAGSQGEYAGLLAIRAYHESRGERDRRVCLIPTSAHGTNPASAVIAGFEVATVACDKHGNIALDDLQAKAAAHGNRLGALMITYPSTHGVFEPHVKEVIAAVHAHGGQVYMDGANLNAQVGLTSPAEIGADVCHLNLHKTFCIPHGGGGPGMGPIAVAEHLAPFLPGHPLKEEGSVGPVSAAPFGSPSILPISWVYIALMGGPGLTRATQVAILSANYMARRLSQHYDLVYTGLGGTVAHEFILDCRAFTKSAHITVEDIAKRLMDYGFHAPTMSWPVAGTLMVEPTESESRAELDRFCNALIAIRQEIRDIEEGRADPQDNPLKHAPHTAQAVSGDNWSHPYSRQQAAYPAPWLTDHKFWPPVARIDNPYGDRNLVCSCPPFPADSE